MDSLRSGRAAPATQRRLGRRRAARRRGGRGQPGAARPRPRARRPARRAGRRRAHRRRRRPQGARDGPRRPRRRHRLPRRPHATSRDYLAQPYTQVVTSLIREHEPQIVLYGATTIGRDLAPRIASALRAGLTADCTDLHIGDHSTRRREEYKDLLYQIRPAFGGNIIATIVSPRTGRRWPPSARASWSCPRRTAARRTHHRRPVTRTPESIDVRDGVALSDADSSSSSSKRVPGGEARQPQGRAHRRLRRRGRRLEQGLQAHLRPGPHGRRRRRRQPRRRGRGLHRQGPPGRPDRHHRAPGALHRLRHQRRRPAPRRHGQNPPRSSPSTRPATPRSSASPTTASSAT